MYEEVCARLERELNSDVRRLLDDIKADLEDSMREGKKDELENIRRTWSESVKNTHAKRLREQRKNFTPKECEAALQYMRDIYMLESWLYQGKKPRIENNTSVGRSGKPKVGSSHHYLCK